MWAGGSLPPVAGTNLVILQINRLSPGVLAAETSTHLQLPGQGGMQPPPECSRQGRARTLSLSPPCIMEPVQDYSTGRSFMTTPSQSPRSKDANICRCLVMAGKHSPPECSRWRRARPVGAACRLRREGANTCSCLVMAGEHSPLECSRQGRARTLSPAPPCTVQADASLLDQSALHGGFVMKVQTPAGALSWPASTLHPSARGRDEHAP